MSSVEENIKIFSEAFQKYGDDVRSCLWGTKQTFRWNEIINVSELDGASVLEIGCGIGSLYEYCIQDRGMKDLTYKGVDLVPEMIDLAKQKFPEAEFEVCNILEQKLEKTYDYVILCGVFNVATKTEEMEKILSEAFQYCKKGMAFNFISTYVNFHDEEMSYHNPQEIFSFCVESLSRKVRMNHHYEKCDVSMFVYKE